MKFYLVHIDGVPQLARTQGDAKAIDKNFKLVEVDVSQQPLMDHLNDLMRRAYGNAVVVEPTERAVADSEPEAGEGIMVDSDGDTLVYAKPKKKDTSKVERMWDQVSVEEFIWNTPADEARRLDQLADIIAERKKEIASQ